MPAPNGGDDLVRVSLPDEGARRLIMLLDEAVDGGLQIDNGVEDAVFQPPPGQLCKEALDGIEP